MSSVTFSAVSQQPGIPPTGKCQQCGATDKKLSRCAQCHIEQYCSRDCQRAAWPKHKLVCQVNSKEQNPNAGDISEVAKWCGKKFGELRGVRTIDKGIRILSHTGGFAVFLPKEVWRPLDYQVTISFPEIKDTSCWIADRESAFVKVDITRSELEGSDKEYASENLEVALNKVEEFVRNNFLDNRQAYPDSSYFTHGSFKDNPDMPRPFRVRLGGDFHYKF